MKTKKYSTITTKPPYVRTLTTQASATYPGSVTLDSQRMLVPRRPPPWRRTLSVLDVSTWPADEQARAAKWLEAAGIKMEGAA